MTGIALAIAPATPGRAVVSELGGRGCSASIVPFGAGNWPPGCWRPYSAASPFNRALPRNPPLVRGSKRIVRRLLSWGKVESLTVGHPQGSSSDFFHPIYYSRPTDPVYRIRCVRWRRTCELHGKRLRIPQQARPAGGSDGHMAVVDQGGRWEYDFWQVRTVPLPAGGGTIRISHGGRTRWGTADANGLASNATAGHFALAAGMIRAEEWELVTSRGGAINHALFIAVRCTAGRSVYPAARRTTAMPCETRRERRHAPRVGSRLYLDMPRARIDRLRAPAWKKPILKAMARHGMIVGDTFGGDQHSFGVWGESDVQYTALGQAGRYAALGRRWGAGTYNGAYVFDIASGINWRRHLRVVRPCVSRRSC